MAATKSSPATKHLTKQYKELHDHPLFGIDAAPLETDVQTWCGNVFFPEDSGYPNLVLHFKLVFDDQYPTTSPKLSLGTPIDHTHVYFPSCCFSLLPDFRSYFEAIGLHKTAYWNPTRTVRGFLESFYQFLVFDVDRESHGRGNITDSHRETAMKAAQSYSCSLCGHTLKDPKPSRPQVTMQESEKYQEESVGKGEKLTEVEQAAADLNCSVCRKTIEETIVGFGVNVEPAKNGVQITSDLYPLCCNCFYDDKVRLSAGGNPITHWIPFAVNDKIWKEKAFEKAKECFATIWTGNPKGFQPEIVFDVIGELWKTKAVEMMKGEEHASQKVLFGFCAFHHLLLAFANSIPELVSKATSRVEFFIADPKNRNKKACPDFGRFLPLFLLSNILWEDEKHAGRVCVSELFTRNAMWILKQHPGLESVNDKDQSRIQKSWDPSQVGLKLTCFQIRYLLEVGRPTNETDINLNYQRFNSLYGRPTQQMVDQFQQTTKKVQAIADYPSWFMAMGLGKPPNEVILGMLQDAMKNSAAQGYHGGNNNNNRGGRGGGRGGRGRGGY